MNLLAQDRLIRWKVLVSGFVLGCTVLLFAFPDNIRGTPPIPVWPGDASLASVPQGQYVFITPDYHELVIVLPASSGQTQTSPRSILRLSLHNEVEPDVKVSVAMNRDTSGLVYRYTVSNAARARDPIGYFGLVAPLMQANPSLTQDQDKTDKGKWVGTSAFALVASQAELPKQPNGRYLYWLAEGDQHGIIPGNSLDGFELKTTYTPGFTTAYLSSRDLPSVPQEWPPEIYGQLNILNDPKWVKQAVLTLGPMFPQKLNRPGDVATNFAEGVKNLVASKKVDENAAWTRELGSFLNQVAMEKSSGDLASFTKLQREAAPGIETEVTNALRMSLAIPLQNSRQ